MRFNFNPLSIVLIVLALATPLVWFDPKFQGDYAKLLNSCLTIAGTAYTGIKIQKKEE